MICISRHLKISDSLDKGQAEIGFGDKTGQHAVTQGRPMYKTGDIFTLEKEQGWQLLQTKQYRNQGLLLQTVMSHPQHSHKQHITSISVKGWIYSY